MFALILASALTFASQPEVDAAALARRAAIRETATEAERAHYMYRQTISMSDYSGAYREVREVIFSPSGERSEVVVGRPANNLRRLRLTEEDFRDIREIQPMLLTTDNVRLYEPRYRGEDTVDGIDCWLLEIRPRQILDGQRLFEGTLWVAKSDDSIIRSEGKAVPDIQLLKQENLFPRFITVRQKVAGFWFPVETHADDTLQFRSGPIRIRLRIEYAKYRKFQAESTIEYK